MTPPIAGDTIFALSSGALPAAIAIVRVSGPLAGAVLQALVGQLPAERRLVYSRLRAADGAVLDHAMIAWLSGPRTATGEDLAEFHLHGGRAVVAAVMTAIGHVPGCRPALPGEFTRRAFANGRIDLAEAEGLADLLSAETERQRHQAMRLAEGGLGRMIEQWRGQILSMAAAVEADIEFGEDEDDVPVIAASQHDERRALACDIERALSQPPAERLRDGVRVVLAGPVNAGKSSLLNALVGREAAIATDVPGTTRDLVEVPVERGGTAFLFIDSAGLRETEDSVEREGIARARQAIGQADILLWLGDPDQTPIHDQLILIAAQADRAGAIAQSGLRTSTVTGEGIDVLWSLLMDRAAALLPAEDMVALNARHRECLTEVRDSLRDAPGDPLLLAEHLRLALRALDRVTGRAGVEDMLDALFGRFCIGK